MKEITRKKSLIIHFSNTSSHIVQKKKKQIAMKQLRFSKNGEPNEEDEDMPDSLYTNPIIYQS